MSIYDKNKGKPGKKPYWFVRYWVEGVEVREAVDGGKAVAAAKDAEIRRQLRAGTWVHPKKRARATTRFDVYARKVITRRTARGVATAAKDEAGHVEHHLIPAFGKYELRELVSFKRVKDGFDQLINAKGLAGRTVRNIHSTFRSIMIEAAEDELIDTPPLPLSARRDHLPPPVDKDEGWREDALFDPSEIVKLALCEAVPSHRLMMYLTWFLTGSRFAEITGLKVRHYNRQKRPLPSLSVHAAKVGRHRGVGRQRREVPVHPDLQRWLDWWLAGEYELLHGRHPGPDDLLFPTLSKRRRNRGEFTCSHGEMWKRWAADLKSAGLRHRRLHDARRTLLSALKNAGVDNDIRRKITHHSVEDRVLDAYTTLEWRVLCEAIGLLQWDLPEPSAPGRIRFLSVARAAREIKGSDGR